jgi:tetratricopeptide (TPR) repeat protein
MNRRERRATTTSKSPAASGIPASSDAAALYQAGMLHLRAERYLDAQVACQQAIAADPNHADSLHLMGLLTFHAEHDDLAVEWVSRAIALDPQPQYFYTLGASLRRQGRLEEALAAFNEGALLKPLASEFWRARGQVLVDLERPEQAALNFQQVVKLKPSDQIAAYDCGSLLCQLDRHEEALPYLNLSDELRANHAPTLRTRGLALSKLGKFEEALADMRRAHGLEPNQADVCNNIGAFLQRLGRYAEALPWFDQAVRLKRDYPTAAINKAYSLGQLHRFDEAFAVYAALKLSHPNHPEATWALSLLQMLTGDFESGFAGREARWKIPTLPIARFSTPKPMWLGREAVAGTTVLIHVDEGLGDTIQFVRYVPMVAARGARVILVVAKSLCPLLSDLPGVSECLPYTDDALPPFDMYCPIGSLPLAFGTRLETIPSETPYLPMPAKTRVQAFEDRLGRHDKLRVGLVWSGNPAHVNDHNRSLPASQLAAILDLDATFVSLQKDAKPADLALLRERADILDLTEHLTDFAETAALVSCLDLVVTIDTSVAHLSGALGRPTWILLPYTPDYRWLLDRDDSPWYPTARLFRQTDSREYASVLSRVRTELSARISAFSPPT